MAESIDKNRQPEKQLQVNFWKDKTPCWEIYQCPETIKAECPAVKNQFLPCWQIEGTYRKLDDFEAIGRDTSVCETCQVYKQYGRGEPIQVTLFGQGLPAREMTGRGTVVVCIKQVPDTTQVKIDPITGTLIREGIPSIINPFDAHALEESLRLKDKYGLKVVAISMGPPSTEITLRKALAMGADDVILLSDRAFGGADTLATSMVLAKAIKRISQKEDVVMVICGKQTIDGDTAQVGPGIATRLKYSQLTPIDRIEHVDMAAKKVRVRRKLEGRYEIVEASLPAMIAVVREINHPRYPTVPMRLMSADAPITVWDNKIMKLSEETIGLKGSATVVRKIFSPERSKGELLGDAVNNPEEAARLLIDTLTQKKIISV